MLRSLLLISLFCTFAFLSCKTEKKDPQQVISYVIEALDQKDFAKVKEFATADSKGFVDMMSTMNAFMKNKAPLQKAPPLNVKYGIPSIHGKEADIDVTDLNSGLTTKYFLKDEDGWKVSLSLSSIIKGIPSTDSSGKPFHPELVKELEKFKSINLDSMSKIIALGLKNLSHSQKDSLDNLIKSNLKEFGNVSQDSLYSNMEKKLKSMDSATKAKQ